MGSGTYKPSLDQNLNDIKNDLKKTQIYSK